MQTARIDVIEVGEYALRICISCIFDDLTDGLFNLSSLRFLDGRKKTLPNAQPFGERVPVSSAIYSQCTFRGSRGDLGDVHFAIWLTGGLYKLRHLDSHKGTAYHREQFFAIDSNPFGGLCFGLVSECDAIKALHSPLGENLLRQVCEFRDLAVRQDFTKGR